MANLTSASHLLLEIRQELHNLRRDVSEIRGILVNFNTNGDNPLETLAAAQRVVLPEVPQDVTDKFLQSIRFNAPETFSDVSGMPLKEGFDALVKNVNWSINGSQKPEKCGQAILQLWQLQNPQTPVEPPDVTPMQSNLSPTSPRTSTEGRTAVAGSRDLSRRSSALSSSTTLFSGSSATSNMAGTRGNEIAVLPEPPVMLFYTVHEGKHAFLHLECTLHRKTMLLVKQWLIMTVSDSSERPHLHQPGTL
ncbi:MAG: hypothetical protein Q9213_006623 [Squamulea squamosa]